MREIFYRVILLLGVSLGQTGVWGQAFIPAEAGMRKKMLEEIGQVSGRIETWECDFIQRKEISVLMETAVSEGKMYYRKPDRMRWEYLHPEAYYFVVNDGKSVLKKNEEVARGGGARIFGEISKMILNCISGRDWVDEKRFKVEYTVCGDIFRIRLLPRSKRMQQLVTALNLEFSIQEHAIRAVEMKQGEDTTRIEFKDKKINKEIASDLFDL